ncbi:hypothetical protein VA599_07565 [Chromobacterium sp. TRC.1.1.SA]|uniref:Uncharacterized protein n=1 Tax=Chromobacterium indicum TaxID=3110228 RepID=A0ABV0CHE5_9NEIS
MIEQIENVLGNSHFEAYWGGPLMGVIFAAIYEKLKKPPSNSDKIDSPPKLLEKLKEERRIIIQQSTKIIIKEKNAASDDSGAIIPIAIAGACLMFLGVAYLHQISHALYTFSTAAASFSFTASILSYFGGRFNTKAWWLHTIIPALASIACFYITICAESAISPDVIKYAQDLLGEQSLNIGLVISGAIKFMQNIRADYVQYIMFDLMAIILVACSSLIAFMQTTHYIALTNATGAEESPWGWLAISTARFSKASTILLLFLLLTLAYLGANGTLYSFLHSQS